MKLRGEYWSEKGVQVLPKWSKPDPERKLVFDSSKTKENSKLKKYPRPNFQPTKLLDFQPGKFDPSRNPKNLFLRPKMKFQRKEKTKR